MHQSCQRASPVAVFQNLTRENQQQQTPQRLRSFPLPVSTDEPASCCGAAETNLTSTKLAATSSAKQRLLTTRLDTNSKLLSQQQANLAAVIVPLKKSNLEKSKAPPTAAGTKLRSR
jgi:hypothetical protein